MIDTSYSKGLFRWVYAVNNSFLSNPQIARALRHYLLSYFLGVSNFVQILKDYTKNKSWNDNTLYDRQNIYQQQFWYLINRLSQL